MGAPKRSQNTAARDVSPDDVDVGPASGVRARRNATRRGPRSAETVRDAGVSRRRNVRRGGVAFVEPALDWADAESFAEEFIASATGAEAVNEASRDEVVVEELGGPFVDAPDERVVYAADWHDDEEPLG